MHKSPESVYEAIRQTCSEKASNIFGSSSGGSSNGKAVRDDCLTAYLRHADAWNVVLKHEAWLKNRIKEIHRHNQSKKDIVIAYLSNNSVEFLCSLVAASKPSGGALPALLNIRWSPQEMARALHSVASTSFTLILYGQGFQETAETVSRRLAESSTKGNRHDATSQRIPDFSIHFWTRIPPSISQSMHALSDEKISLRIHRIAESQAARTDAMIVFTSGTSGNPKGVRLSHTNLLVQAWAKCGSPCRYQETTVVQSSVVPWFHIGGLNSALAVWLAGGSFMFSAAHQSFSAAQVWKSLDPDMHLVPVNTLVVVPAMLVSLLESRVYVKKSFLHVQLILIGGQSASKRIIQQLRQVFPNARLVQTYACTEAASSLTFYEIPKEDSYASAVGFCQCVGKPPAHIQLDLLDLQSNQTIRGQNQSGRITSLGPHVMNGYWKRGNKSTAQDRVLQTSDVGVWDAEGNLWFCGRLQDTIRTGGETVLALEVEQVLLVHDEIKQAAVFAQPHDRWGEAVACALVSDSRHSLSLDVIRQWCKDRGLASFKCPKYVYFMNDLPKTSSGKVMKHRLVEQFATANVSSKL